ncbi:putative spindle-pole body protein [Trichoderma novae-zelandiae]
MAHQGFGGVLDTPRSNAGDATYLSKMPDFADISQEASFLAPDKDDDLLQQLRNGRSNGTSIRTPRRRTSLADRRNLPSNIGGGEFTPLLKSATVNSTRRNGKGAAVTTTPAPLNRIDEDDMTPIARMDFSAFSARNASFLDNELPHIDASSAASTPMAFPPRRDADKGPLQDGNQLSLREQENVIDKIEKENFGLKLKIHFLEEALKKAGPGYSEAALKENTELKVDKVTMQRELQRYKKQVMTAERDLESFRQQMLELQEKAKQKYSNANDHQAELERLRTNLEDRESNIKELQRQASEDQGYKEMVEKLQADIEDLEAEIREKDRLITEGEDKLEAIQENDHNDQLDEVMQTIEELQQQLQDFESQNVSLEEALETNQTLVTQLRGELSSAREELSTVHDELRQARKENQTQANRIKQLEARGESEDKTSQVIEELQQQLQDVEGQNETLEETLEANQGLVSKLRTELSSAQNELSAVHDELRQTQKEYQAQVNQVQQLKAGRDDEGALHSHIHELEEALDTNQAFVAQLRTELSSVQDQLRQTRRDYQAQVNQVQQLKARGEADRSDEGTLSRHIYELEDALETNQGLVTQLRNELSSVHEELRQTRRDYQAQVNQVQQLKARGETDGVLNYQVDELQKALETRQGLLTQLRGELSTVRDELRQTQVKYQAQLNRAEQLEARGDSARHRNEEETLRQMNDLQEALETRQSIVTQLRSELSSVRDELRQTRIDYQAQLNRVQQLEARGDSAGKESQVVKELQKQLGEMEDQKLLLEEMLEAKEEAEKTATQRKLMLERMLEEVRRENKKTATQHELELEEMLEEAKNTAAQHELELEELIEEAREEAEKTATQHELELQRLLRRLDKAERERDAAFASHTDTSKQGQRLRKSQADVETLEEAVVQQQELIDGLVASEAVVRQKLERARSERAAYRMSAEKLQNDLQLLRKEAQLVQRQDRHHYSTDDALTTIVRAAEDAEARHKKELDSMLVQMDWMHARWEREASLRKDSAYAKKFLQLQLNVAAACNTAQLRELEHVRTHVLHSRKPLTLPKPPSSAPSPPTLKSFFIMARFIARTRIAARNWAAQEAIHQKLRLAAEEKRRKKRSKQLKVVSVDAY